MRVYKILAIRFSLFARPILVNIFKKRINEKKLPIRKTMSAEIRIYVSTTPGSLERKKMIERTVNVIKGLAARFDYTVG